MAFGVNVNLENNCCTRDVGQQNQQKMLRCQSHTFICVLTLMPSSFVSSNTPIARAVSIHSKRFLFSKRYILVVCYACTQRYRRAKHAYRASTKPGKQTVVPNKTTTWKNTQPNKLGMHMLCVCNRGHHQYPRPLPHPPKYTPHPSL